MKKAFTMIELVFVIVVIGILAATIIPSVKTNPVQEAAIQLVSHIRYTQHLAMVDDKHNDPVTDSDWEKGRWQMVFAFVGAAVDNHPSYTIFSDNDNGSGYGGDASSSEMAKNPQNIDQVMTGGHTGASNLTYADSSFIGVKKMNLGGSYGITGISRTGGCSNLYHLTFDHLGRPMKGTHSPTTNTHSYISSDCNLTLTDGTQSVSVIVTAETGYAYLEQI